MALLSGDASVVHRVVRYTLGLAGVTEADRRVIRLLDIDRVRMIQPT